MLILRASQFAAGNTNEDRIGFGSSTSIQLVSTKTIALDSGENQTNWTDADKTKINVLTIFQSGTAKLYIRLINCAVIVTTFMIAVIETDPGRDSIVEFLDTTSTNLLNMPIMAYESGGASKEIKIVSSGAPTDLSASVTFVEPPSTTAKTSLTDLVGKFIKIFDKTTKKKSGYVLDFEIDRVLGGSVTKFTKLVKTTAAQIAGTSLEMTFGKFIDVFEQSIKDTIFDDTSLMGQLNTLKKKNQKMEKALQHIKTYLNNSKNNLNIYKS